MVHVIYACMIVHKRMKVFLFLAHPNLLLGKSESHAYLLHWSLCLDIINSYLLFLITISNNKCFMQILDITSEAYISSIILTLVHGLLYISFCMPENDWNNYGTWPWLCHHLGTRHWLVAMCGIMPSNSQFLWSIFVIHHWHYSV